MVGSPAAAYFRRAALGLISVYGLIYGTVIQAGDWTIKPSVSVSEAFTDNSGLNSNNEDRNSDFTTLVSPGLSITGTGGRSSLNLNYAFNRTYYHRKTQNDGAQPSEHERRGEGSFSHVLDRKLTFIAGVVWEGVEDPGITSQPKGITWSGGFTVRPSSRTSLQFSYGDRNGDTNINANASHRISARSTVDASFSESIQTSQSLIAQQLLNFTTDPNAGVAPVVNPDLTPLIDPISGNPVFGVTLTQLGLSESTFRQQVFWLGFSGSTRRNTFSGGGFWEERDTESTGIKEKYFGGNLSERRRLSPRHSGSVGIAV